MNKGLLVPSVKACRGHLEMAFSVMGSSVCRDCLSWIFDGPLDCPKCGSLRIVNHIELAALDIAHVDCDAFYAAVEKRDNPHLRDKPLIIGSSGGRGVVTTACYLARQFGPRSAMPMFKARKLCPQAIIMPPNMSKYREASQQIRDIFKEATPVFQSVSLDEAYLDLSGQVRVESGDLPALTIARVAARIEEVVGITVSIGLSYNKFLAKLASDFDKPRGYSVIGRAEAVSFLAKLPVKKINGIGIVTARKMAEQGIENISQLQALSESELVGRFGKFGRRLADYVSGQDNRKVSIGGTAKSISAESTFKKDLYDSDDLKEQVQSLCETVANRLNAKGLAARTLVLKLKTSDFKIVTRNRQLPNATQRASLIYNYAALLIDAEVDGRAFRLIGVGVHELCQAMAADPPDLFDRL